VDPGSTRRRHGNEATAPVACPRRSGCRLKRLRFACSPAARLQKKAVFVQLCQMWHRFHPWLCDVHSIRAHPPPL